MLLMQEHMNVHNVCIGHNIQHTNGTTADTLTQIHAKIYTHTHKNKYTHFNAHKYIHNTRTHTEVLILWRSASPKQLPVIGCQR